MFFLFQVASVTVIHVPDDKYRLSARVLFQYLLTSQGSMYELKVCPSQVAPFVVKGLWEVSLTKWLLWKICPVVGAVSCSCFLCYNILSIWCLPQPLFMSADSGGMSGPPDSEQSSPPSEPTIEASGVGQRPVLLEEGKEEEEEEDWLEGTNKDCVVCQNAAVNRVLLPCRHACVCDSCVSHFQHCPICRAFVIESFSLTRGPAEQWHWSVCSGLHWRSIGSLYSLWYCVVQRAVMHQHRPENCNSFSAATDSHHHR